jgi:putative tryptophan/tyrosine transport system substrate-binding protein
MRRRDLLLTTLVIPFLPAPAPAQASPTSDTRSTFEIGFLGAASPSELADRIEALREGLRQLGYVEGRNITIHYRWAEGRYERLSELAAELVRLNVDVILSQGTPGTRAALAATTTIPIVAITIGDLLSSGLVPSLARPGANLTGQAFFLAEICAKRVELIKKAIPGATRIGVIVNPDNSSHPIALAAMTRTAQALRLDLLSVRARTRDKLIGAFDRMAKEGTHAVAVIDDPFLTGSAPLISELALTNRIPSIGQTAHPKAGGFMAYGADIRDLWFRSATIVDRILQGTKPADIPVQQATKFELIINLRTAQALGLTPPPSILARADEVIE